MISKDYEKNYWTQLVMPRLSFIETMNEFNLITSSMDNANKKNDILFRKISKEVFQKSYSKLEIQIHLNTGAKIAGVGIVSAIKMARGQYTKGSFAKSFKKLHHHNAVFTYSDLKQINYFLDTSEFLFVAKLLKIQYNYGLNKTISIILK